MKKFLLILVWVMIGITSRSQSNYTSFGGNNGALKGKYNYTVVFDEKAGTMTVSGDAPFIEATLTGFTKAQYATRKGSQNSKYFPTKVRKFSFDMNTPGLKDRYMYWLKIYPEGSRTPEEYLYTRKSSAPAIDESAQEAEGTGNTDVTEESKYEFFDKSNRDRVEGKVEPQKLPRPTAIKTNITCVAGKQKVTTALSALDGVMKVTIDLKTGTMQLYYSQDGTPYNEIIETINGLGFSADDKPAKKGVSNVCGGKN